MKGIFLGAKHRTFNVLRLKTSVAFFSSAGGLFCALKVEQPD